MSDLNQEKIETVFCYEEIESDTLPDKIINYKLTFEDATFKYKFASHKINKKENEVVGYTKNNQCYLERDLNPHYQYLIVNKEESEYFLKLTNKKGFFKRTVGYVKVDENKYVGLTKDTFLFIILFFGLLAILIALTMIKCHNKDLFPQIDENISNLLEFEDEEKWDGVLPQNGKDFTNGQESLTFPGYANLYFDKNHDTLELINPDNNTAYFVYDIKLDGTSILKTKAIKPGNMTKVNLREILNTGTYTLIFSISTYDISNETPCTPLDQVVNVTIK